MKKLKNKYEVINKILEDYRKRSEFEKHGMGEQRPPSSKIEDGVCSTTRHDINNLLHRLICAIQLEQMKKEEK